jgi:hypothetical protein
MGNKLGPACRGGLSSEAFRICVGPPGPNRKSVSRNIVTAASARLSHDVIFNKPTITAKAQVDRNCDSGPEARHILCRWRQPPETLHQNEKGPEGRHTIFIKIELSKLGQTTSFRRLTGDRS